MLCLVSDIHGKFGAFKTLLKKINFDPEKDNMIILGDVIDRGEESIELLNYIKPMIEKHTIELLLGNHELFCIMYLDGILDADMWSAFGGEDTLKAVKKMSEKDKDELKCFLKSLPLYSENYSKFLGNFICTHSGLHADYLIRNRNGTINVKKSIEEAFKNDYYRLMCGMDLHYLSKKDKENMDSFLVVGHVPCNRLRESMNDNRFIRTPYYMDIDAGSGHEGGLLGCYIVDTDEEVYV